MVGTLTPRRTSRIDVRLYFSSNLPYPALITFTRKHEHRVRSEFLAVPKPDLFTKEFSLRRSGENSTLGTITNVKMSTSARQGWGTIRGKRHEWNIQIKVIFGDSFLRTNECYSSWTFRSTTRDLAFFYVGLEWNVEWSFFRNRITNRMNLNSI